MKHHLSKELVILQHQLMMVLGTTTEPDEMLMSFSQQAIESMQLTAVYIDQKTNTNADIDQRSLSYYLDDHHVSSTPSIAKYHDAVCPTDSKYLECLTIEDDNYLYCFSLKNIGYLALQRSQPFSDQYLVAALTEVVQRMSKAYSGRKQFLLNKKQQTEISQISNRLQSEKSKLEHILSSVKDCIFVLDVSGKVYFTNPAASTLLGKTKKEMLNKHFRKICRIYDIESNEDITQHIAKLSINEGKWSNAHPVVLRTRENKEFFIHLSVKKMSGSEYADNKVTEYFVSTFHDMTDSYKLEQKLQWQSTHDALTGCLNRHGFHERIKSHLHHRATTDSLSFISIDLDHFKFINDISGHCAGDALLKHVVQLLEHNIDNQGAVVRLGGDEFGIIFHKTPPSIVETLAENIRQSIDLLSFKWEGNAFSIGASIGIAHVNDDIIDIKDMLTRADEACLASKENGRNQITVASPVKQRDAHQENELISAPQRNYLHYINSALMHSNNEYQLVLYKQDISAISDQYINDHHEILLRLVHGDTVISPHTFLPAAERSGLIREIDFFVLTQTIKHIANNPDDAGHYNVNLSGVSLSDQMTRRRIFELLSNHPVQAKHLCLEVTETAAITNFPLCISFMEKLNNYGVNFALDDFGTGLSSFSYLKSFPVTYLKIDGSFIHNICNNEIDQIVVQSIVSACKAMKIRTVAEYVSDEAILSKVTSLGIDYAQGYWMSMPTRLN